MSDKEIFNKSGPVHLTTVDWSNSYDQKSVAACLVRAAYVMELDRQNNRLFTQALAPPWWKFFHFELRHLLIVDVNTEPAIFGAVFTLNPRHGDERAPRCVVAFRGTTTRKSSAVLTDIKLDLSIAWNGLQESLRFRKALEAVDEAVKEFGAENVWIAGHSLGAAIGLLAGRSMAKRNVLVEAFLFNPPFASLPIGRIIRTSAVRTTIRFVGNVVTEGVALFMGRDEEAPFKAWSKWHPRLFLNKHDHLCLEYINYFERRKVWNVAAQQSVVSLVLGAIDAKWGEATDLIPSAHVTVDHGADRALKDAHGIRQWWRPNLYLETKTYTFPNQS